MPSPPGRQHAGIDEAQQDRRQAEADQSQSGGIGGGCNDDCCVFRHGSLPFDSPAERCTNRAGLPARAGRRVVTASIKGGSRLKAGMTNGFRAYIGVAERYPGSEQRTSDIFFAAAYAACAVLALVASRGAGQARGGADRPILAAHSDSVCSLRGPALGRREHRSQPRPSRLLALRGIAARPLSDGCNAARPFAAAVAGLLLFRGRSLHPAVRGAAIVIILLVLLALAQSVSLYRPILILQAMVGPATVSRIIEAALLIILALCATWYRPGPEQRRGGPARRMKRAALHDCEVPVTTRTLGAAQIITGVAAAIALLHFLALDPDPVRRRLRACRAGERAGCALIRERCAPSCRAWAVSLLAGLVVIGASSLRRRSSSWPRAWSEMVTQGPALLARIDQLVAKHPGPRLSSTPAAASLRA